MVSIAITAANMAKGLSLAVFSVSLMAVSVLSETLCSLGHVSLDIKIKTEGITETTAMNTNIHLQLRQLIIKEPTEGARIGPIIAADCKTVITLLNLLPEKVSFIIAVVTVRIIPLPIPARPLTTMRNSTLPAKVHKNVKTKLNVIPTEKTGFLPYLSLKGPPIRVPTAVVIIPIVSVKFK